MDEIDSLSYPKTISDNAPILPAINLKCVTKAARNYLLGADKTSVPSSQPSDSLQPSISSAPTDSPHPSAAPSYIPTSVPSLAPTQSAAPSEETYNVPFKATVTGFLNAIAEGCSSDSFSFGGGYNSTAGELAMDIVVELGGSRNLQQALNSLASLLNLPLDASFFDQLSFLEDISLGGNLLIDLTIGASIDKNVVNSTSFGDVDVFITINRFMVSQWLFMKCLVFKRKFSYHSKCVALSPHR